MLRQFHGNLRRYAALALVHCADGLQQFLAQRAFQQEAGGATLDRAQDLRVTLEGSQHDDARVGEVLADCRHRFHAAHFRHGDIHHGHVGAQRVEALDRLAAVGGFAGHFHVGLAGDGFAQAGAQQWVVVDHQDADRTG